MCLFLGVSTFWELPLLSPDWQRVAPTSRLLYLYLAMGISGGLLGLPRWHILGSQPSSENRHQKLNSIVTLGNALFGGLEPGFRGSSFTCCPLSRTSSRISSQYPTSTH